MDTRPAVPFLLIAALIAGSLLSSGCGSGDEPSTSHAGRPTQATPTAPSSVDTTSNNARSEPRHAPAARSRPTSQTPEVDLYHWKDFPRDVFFEDPFAQLSPAEPPPDDAVRPRPAADDAGSATMQEGLESEGAAAPTSSPADAAGATAGSSSRASSRRPPLHGEPVLAPGAARWSQLIPAEVLAEEVEAVRTSLDAALADVTRYNTAYKRVRADATVLAILAGIATHHSGPIPWKQSAPQVRDLAGAMATAARGLGDRSYKPIRADYDKVVALLLGNRNNVEGLDPDPIRDMPWENVIRRLDAMQRVKLAHEERLKPMTADAATFQQNRAAVGHEAALLAALAQVIGTSFEEAADEAYVALAMQLRDQSAELVQAARQGNFDRVGQLVAANGKTCTDCHREFRFGGVEF